MNCIYQLLMLSLILNGSAQCMESLYFKKNAGVKQAQTADDKVHDQVQICYLNKLPREPQSLIALYCYCNDLKEQQEEKKSNLYIYGGKLYKKNTHSFWSIAARDTLVWQDEQYPRSLFAYIAPVTANAPEYNVLKVKPPFIVATSQKFFSKNTESILFIDKKKNNTVRIDNKDNRNILYATVSCKGDSLYTVERGGSVTSNDEQSKQWLITRSRENDQFPVNKKIKLPADQDYKKIDYFDSFNMLGLLKDDLQTVQLVSFNDPINYSQDHLGNYFHQKRVCKKRA